MKSEPVYAKEKESSFIFRTAESFLNGLNKNTGNNNVDLTQYKAGIRVFHKKFGEGTINSVEPEGEDLKVDIDFDKAGHKRLMAKYANLQVIEQIGIWGRTLKSLYFGIFGADLKNFFYLYKNFK